MKSMRSVGYIDKFTAITLFVLRFEMKKQPSFHQWTKAFEIKTYITLNLEALKVVN